MNNGIKHLPRFGRKKVGIFDIDSLFFISLSVIVVAVVVFSLCAFFLLRFGIWLVCVCVHFSTIFCGIFVVLPLRQFTYMEHYIEGLIQNEHKHKIDKRMEMDGWFEANIISLFTGGQIQFTTIASYVDVSSHKGTEWESEREREIRIQMTQERKRGRNREWNAIVSSLFHSLHLQSRSKIL